MSQKRTVPVKIQGREYKIRADGDADSVHRAAALLDDTMSKVRARSGIADRVLELIRLVESAVGDAKPAAS